jgi:hypothetical protein
MLGLRPFSFPEPLDELSSQRIDFMFQVPRTAYNCTAGLRPAAALSTILMVALGSLQTKRGTAAIVAGVLLVPVIAEPCAAGGCATKCRRRVISCFPCSQVTLYSYRMTLCQFATSCPESKAAPLRKSTSRPVQYQRPRPGPRMPDPRVQTAPTSIPPASVAALPSSP